jgi:hypothetical protein
MPGLPAAFALLFVRKSVWLGRLGSMEILVIEVIQQHGYAGQSSFIILQILEEGNEALHALGLQPVALSQASLQQGLGPLADDVLYLILRGKRALLQVNLEALADAHQLGLLERVDQ